MTEAQNPEDRSKKRVEALQAIQPSKYELWKYYEDRADRLGERLWSIGIWLMTILAGTLSIPFAANFIKPTGAPFPLKIVSPLPVAMLSVFGLLFCLYAYAALRDLREHIESNWRKSGYVLDGTWEATWEGRKSRGWNVLLGVGILAFAAFTLLLALCFLDWKA